MSEKSKLVARARELKVSGASTHWTEETLREKIAEAEQAEDNMLNPGADAEKPGDQDPDYTAAARALDKSEPFASVHVTNQAAGIDHMSGADVMRKAK